MRGVAALLAMTMLVGTASAQTATAGLTSYPADYFTQFAPSTALQVVERVPGFSIESGDSDVRGFGQTAGNVVINGQRPSSKSDDLETILSRIPASRVARVDIGPGERFGAEFTGKPQVVNLVLVAGGGLAGTLEATVRRVYDGTLLPEGSASASVRRGASTFNASLAFSNEQSTEEGTDTISARPSGAVTERRRKVNTIRDPYGTAAVSWDYNGGTNRTAHLNGKLLASRFELTQANAVQPVGGTPRNDRLSQRFDREDYEIGGDITWPLLGGGLKLIGLATHRDRTNTDVSFNRVNSVVLGGFSQTLDDARDERVMRLVFNRPGLGAWTLETGVEGALNRLESDVDLFSIASGGVRTQIDLPVDQAVVKEVRGEAFVNAGRALTPRLRADFGLTYETSKLTVRGDAIAERSLSFLKPKATFDWRPKGAWHVQFSVTRTVAQLQFEDFISSAELTNDRVNGGNADLLPQRAWEFLLTVEHPILGDGLIKAEVEHRRISLLQDRVPTPAGFDAPGNLGDARRTTLRGTIDAPLGKLGIKGGRLTAHGTVNDTAVEDPYTLRDRHFSGIDRWEFDIGFRQDLGKFAWGVTAYGESGPTFYRQNEIDHPVGTTPYVVAFVEYRPTTKTTLSFNLDNATDAQATRERTFFTPTRANSNPSLYEYRERNRHIVPYLTLKHSFG